MSYSTPFCTWVSTEIPARPDPLCRWAEPLGSVSGGYCLDSAPVPLQPRRALGLTPQPSPPKLVPTSPTAAAWAPLSTPPMLLTPPPQSAVVPLQAGDGTVVAVRYSPGTAPISSGKRRRGESPAGSWFLLPVLHPALPLALWNRHWPGCHDSVITPECGPVLHGDRHQGGWSEGVAEAMGSAVSPRYMDQSLHAQNQP